jgi:hypothetical protein
MHALGLTPEQFHRVVRACGRVLVNPLSPGLDLRLFLAARLSDDLPDVAARIERFDDRQVAALREEIVTALQGGADSDLWE